MQCFTRTAIVIKGDKMKVVLMKGDKAIISYKVSMLKSIKFDNDTLMYIVEFKIGRAHV